MGNCCSLCLYRSSAKSSRRLNNNKRSNTYHGDNLPLNAELEDRLISLANSFITSVILPSNRTSTETGIPPNYDLYLYVFLGDCMEGSFQVTGDNKLVPSSQEDKSVTELALLHGLARDALNVTQLISNQSSKETTESGEDSLAMALFTPPPPPPPSSSSSQAKSKSFSGSSTGKSPSKGRFIVGVFCKEDILLLLQLEPSSMDVLATGCIDGSLTLNSINNMSQLQGLGEQCVFDLKTHLSKKVL